MGRGAGGARLWQKVPIDYSVDARAMGPCRSDCLTPRGQTDCMTIRTSMTAAAVLAVVVIAGYVFLDRLVWHNRLPDGLIQANGRIEGDHVTVASKFPGRVIELAAREGAEVLKGSVLIRLDDAQTRAKVDQAARLVDSLMAQVEAAPHGLAVLNLEVPLSIEAAAAKVESARRHPEGPPSNMKPAATPSASVPCFPSRPCRSNKWIRLMRGGKLP